MMSSRRSGEVENFNTLQISFCHMSGTEWICKELTHDLSSRRQALFSSDSNSSHIFTYSSRWVFSKTYTFTSGYRSYVFWTESMTVCISFGNHNTKDTEHVFLSKDVQTYKRKDSSGRLGYSHGMSFPTGVYVSRNLERCFSLHTYANTQQCQQLTSMI